MMGVPLAFPMLLARWDETCLVIRVGTEGVIVDRADVEARMGKWTNTDDPKIVRPKPPQSEETTPPKLDD